MRIHLSIRVPVALKWRALAELLGVAAPETPYVSCPECGSGYVKRLKRTDDVDRVSKVPWSAIQRYFGGRLFYCSACRLQFHDCRRKVLPRPSLEKPGLQIVPKSPPVLTPSNVLTPGE